MKLLSIVSALLVALTPAKGDNLAALRKAAAPIDEGIPQVAVERLHALLLSPLSAPEAKAARQKLVAAFVLCGRAEEALPLFQEPDLTNDSEADFWHAQALAALGRWDEARSFYTKVASDLTSPRHAEAQFGLGQSYHALGRMHDAVVAFRLLNDDSRFGVPSRLRLTEILIGRGDLTSADRLLRETKPKEQSERNERRWLFGKLNLALHQPARAVEALTPLLKKPEGVSHSLLIAAVFTFADAYLQAQTPESGDDGLEQFIEHHPNDSALPEVFAKLDELYRAEQKPSPNELERWTRDAAQPRRVLAQWYLARSEMRAGDKDKAIDLLQQVLGSGVRLLAIGEANLELAQLQLDRGKWDEAISAAEAARTQNTTPRFLARSDWLIAEVNYRQGKLELAAPLFETIAQRDQSLANAGLFNAALCWLRLNRTQNFSSDYRQISNASEGVVVEGELLLEEGAIQAAQGKIEEARNSFENFIRRFPASARRSEAWVALAELAFHAAPPDVDTARRDLTQARQSSPTASAIERADYLQIWLEEVAAPEKDASVIATAGQFLQQHPDSRFVPEVRMKLAEAYFRRQDFANAQTQFELLAQQHPDSPFTEKALFFAARAAMSTMGAESIDHALALLDQVAKMNGDLKWAARNEEAAIERRLGKNREALALYDEVLKNDAKPPEHREALCGKADIYYEMGATDSKNYQQAIELYDRLTNEPGLPAHWHNQAQFKKGKCLEKLHNNTGALTTYYTVLEEGARPEVQHEFFWLYKAGFNAAQLLEEQQDWRAAVAVYRRLASIGGARSEEAKARLTQLRLEHFLWEE